jgi:hypothetical protein
LRDIGRPKEYISAKKPLLMLLEQLTRRECNQIHLHKKGVKLALRKNAAAFR